MTGLGKVKIRFIRPWGQYRKGDEIWPPGTLRQWLIERGHAEVAIDDAPETAMVEPQTEKAVKPRGRPRGRPRKDGTPPRQRKQVTNDAS